MSKNAIKVSELNNYIKKIIDMDYLIKNIAVEGEISNLKKHSNGNIYFSLKDEKSRINAIVYSTNANFDFDLQEGMSIIATGVVSFYDREGQINFYIDEIKLRGEGYLYQDFLNLKKKLGSEGLFDARHKKKIVKYPKSIGLITSDTGAAVRDVLNNLYKRNNLVDVYLYPSFVQGRLASESVINGIKFFNENKKVDTIVIARGGGSFEDLSAFNDEKLAREIYSSDIPIISAIGHEIDFCISDFVADLRASTPTNAVELVTGSKKDLINELFDLISNLFNSMNNRIHREKYQNLDLFNTLSQKNPIGLINKEERKLDFLKRHLDFNIQNKMHSNQNRMLEAKINLKSYDLKKDDDYRRLSNLKFYLNKNFSSKLHLNENYLRYNLNYLEKSAASNLENSKSR
ncbi:exodeoxyribonuclease VII large subunit, partial [Peptoniphilus sp.]|uniref:exodeoxyribonuclease VII large subunit n=1 Tax=Peptoniphilus sp. TaxID=1971214 RepID=UPI003D8FC5A0